MANNLLKKTGSKAKTVAKMAIPVTRDVVWVTTDAETGDLMGVYPTRTAARDSLTGTVRRFERSE